MKCGKCEATMRLVENQTYHYTESGLDNLYLKGITVRRCEGCGLEYPLIPAIDELHRQVARAIALKPAPLAGPEARFLRKQLGYSAKRWAALMHVAPETLSRWETGAQQLGAQSDLLTRLLYVRIREEQESAFVGADVTARVESLDFEDSPERNLVVPAERPSEAHYMTAGASA